MDGGGGSSGHDVVAKPTINITVKFSGRSIPLAISPESTIKEIKSTLQPLTNVLPRGQKLISKGKVLADSMTLRESDVKNGAKIMLMASQGLHQGDGPILKEASTRPIIRRNNSAGNVENQKTALIDKTRLGRWKATGSVGLADSTLKAIPDEVWSVGPSVKFLDISNNTIQDVPSNIGNLTSMQKLLLNANELSDDSISWEGLASLKQLTLLSMNHNHLVSLPSVLGSLSSLRQLDISFNKLTNLPEEIGHLSQLEVLKANNNRISSIPTSIGNCRSLVEINLSYNLLAELPESISNLQNLKSLYLSNNGLKSVPSGLFKMCIHLSTLDLYNTEITTDVLRQFEGWEEFEERRRLKHQKQLDFRVVGPGSAQFDEGADKK